MSIKSRKIMALCILLCASVFISLTPNGSAILTTSNNEVENGVDVFRGVWGGTLTAPNVNVQINLFFTSCVTISAEAGQFKASGYFTYDPVGGQKRASTQALPLIAFIQQTDDKQYDITIFANAIVDESQPAIIIKLKGQATFMESSVTDDHIVGNLVTNDASGNVIGQFSLTHLDRRNISPPQTIPQPSLIFSCTLALGFSGDGNLPLEERHPNYAFDVSSNIVMDRVKVIFPDGTSYIIEPYSDIFSPYVDWITSFRFNRFFLGLPVQYQPYTFIALDVNGNPIPGVKGSVTVEDIVPPDPPQNVKAQVINNKISLTWSAVETIPESFDPEVGIGNYQIVLNNFAGEMIYGAIVQKPSHLIPYSQEDMTGQDFGIPLSQMSDGTYRIIVNAWAEDPLGCPIVANDWSQTITICVTAGNVQVLT